MAKNLFLPSFKRVMITGFTSLRGVAMAIPTIYPMCHANENVSFVLPTNKQFVDLFINKPKNLTVLGIETKKYRTVFGAIKLAKNLQMRYNFDAVADLQNTSYTWCIDKFMKRKQATISRLDRLSKDRRNLLNGKQRKAMISIHERYRDVFSNLGLLLGEDFISILNYGDPINSSIVPEKGEQERWIAIAPFARHNGKAYPIEQTEMIITELSRWDNTHIFLFGGGKTERAILDTIMRRSKKVTSVPHIEHTFADEFDLLHHCDVMLTLDSANMHLASLVELPVVSVWGATHPWCGEMGWHQAYRDTVQADLDCRPCSMLGNKRCRFGDYRCLHDISPEMILKKVQRILDRKN